MEKVVVRFAPSPTGKPHLGAIRTALFNYLFAKKNSGKIILRFEDTDKLRSKKEFENNITETFSWVGLDFDEVFRQSERVPIYKKHLEKLIEDGLAYVSKEEAYVEDTSEDEAEAREKPERRSEVIRFKNPNKKVTFNDIVSGEISVETEELKDFVIAKSLEEPLYHFAVVVDDFEMGVTHVIRGADGIYNTPRQILIGEAIGAPRPKYCHIPFVLGEDKKKLSKRDPSSDASYLEKMGILPEALLNYLALLGWHPKDDREIFSLEELIEIFDLERVQKSPAIFNKEKLLWVNKEHLKKLSDLDFKKKVLDRIPNLIKDKPLWSEERVERLLKDIRERISVFSDVDQMAESGELEYIFGDPNYQEDLLIKPSSKDGKLLDVSKTIEHLNFIFNEINKNNGNLSRIEIKNLIWDYATKEGRGEVLWPMRVSLSGREKSLDPFAMVEILGKEESLKRIQNAVKKLQNKKIED